MPTSMPPDPDGRRSLQGIDPAHLEALAYHPLTPGRDELHERLRFAAKAFAATVDQTCPRSREAELAFTSIQEALMWANAAVAIHDPQRRRGATPTSS